MCTQIDTNLFVCVLVIALTSASHTNQADASEIGWWPQNCIVNPNALIANRDLEGWLANEEVCLDKRRPSKLAAFLNPSLRSIREDYKERQRREQKVRDQRSLWGHVFTWNQRKSEISNSLTHGSCSKKEANECAALRSFFNRDSLRTDESVELLINTFFSINHSNYCGGPLTRIPSFSYLAKPPTLVEEVDKALAQDGCMRSSDVGSYFPDELFLKKDEIQTIYIHPHTLPIIKVRPYPNNSLTWEDGDSGIPKVRALEVKAHSPTFRPGRIELDKLGRVYVHVR